MLEPHFPTSQSDFLDPLATCAAFSALGKQGMDVCALRQLARLRGRIVAGGPMVIQTLGFQQLFDSAQQSICTDLAAPWALRDAVDLSTQFASPGVHLPMSLRSLGVSQQGSCQSRMMWFKKAPLLYCITKLALSPSLCNPFWEFPQHL